MIAYRYDTEQKNKYAGEQPCQRDPISSLIAGKDVFLLPGNCTYEKPLTPKDGFDIVFDIAKKGVGVCGDRKGGRRTSRARAYS